MTPFLVFLVFSNCRPVVLRGRPRGPDDGSADPGPGEGVQRELSSGRQLSQHQLLRRPDHIVPRSQRGGKNHHHVSRNRISQIMYHYVIMSHVYRFYIWTWQSVVIILPMYLNGLWAVWPRLCIWHCFPGPSWLACSLPHLARPTLMGETLGRTWMSSDPLWACVLNTTSSSNSKIRWRCLKV